MATPNGEDRYERVLRRIGRTGGLLLFFVASGVALSGREVNPLILTLSFGLYATLKVPDIIEALRRGAGPGSGG